MMQKHSVPMQPHVKLSKKTAPKDDAAVNSMKAVPFSSAWCFVMHALAATRPDIAYAMQVVSRFMANPTKTHSEAIKRTIRYLKGTKSKYLCYGNGTLELHSNPLLDICFHLPVVQFHGVLDCRGSLHHLLLRLNIFQQPRPLKKPYGSFLFNELGLPKLAPVLHRDFPYAWWQRPCFMPFFFHQGGDRGWRWTHLSA